MASNNKKTVLFPVHQREGARIAPFAGFDMPIQYSGIIDEHLRTRRETGIFDTCHMGEFIISGAKAITDLDNILTCNVASLQIGKCRYGMMCTPQGGVIDDLVVYKLSPDRCMLVVNAGNRADDFDWIEKHISDETTLEDISETTAKIDVQGPMSRSVVSEVIQEPLEDIRYFAFTISHYRDTEILISRTGYTGELGFEIYLPPALAENFWGNCREAGATAAGLGARDTLRLEIGLPLYGHELTLNRNAAESGFDFAIAKDKDFIGASEVRNRENILYALKGLKIDGKRSARHKDIILSPKTGTEIGWITSASYAPSLEQPIAMAYINRNAIDELDNEVVINRGKKTVKASLVQLPFYKDGTARSG
ncbi:MAG: glycine cleavage system aminomethyltransferase GcvT [Verrucomicrobiota bacterium]